MNDPFSFPWERNEKPYFTNPEGIEWYIDKEMTEYAKQDTPVHAGLKNVYCFLTKKDDDINRVMIDDKQNLLYDTKNFEAMAVRIDMMKANETYDKAEKQNRPS